ncbi:D-inositol-3-phosphate glycosyltransferase [Sulfuracidifex tepidarius]|uniref:D-inositol-3-phosphate glycosyltransferase n=2 Tax=Sulfuracidifex tepidarius TaxID=1294262 RepID=A0A510DSR3_9CREN|nr:D-inositol-3-phosphate glycosyltransferase [Sulfuracidifex tepidarius]
MAEIYRASKVFLYTSKLEAFPLPPLEAMASGTAVVSTDNIGIREYGLHRYNCLLDTQHNEINLSRYTLELLNNEDFRLKLVRNGLSTVQKYSWNVIVENWMKMLEEITNDFNKNIRI